MQEHNTDSEFQRDHRDYATRRKHASRGKKNVTFEQRRRKGQRHAMKHRRQQDLFETDLTDLTDIQLKNISTYFAQDD